jgi:hypothetical protein
MNPAASFLMYARCGVVQQIESTLLSDLISKTYLDAATRDAATDLQTFNWLAGYQCCPIYWPKYFRGNQISWLSKFNNPTDCFPSSSTNSILYLF